VPSDTEANGPSGVGQGPVPERLEVALFPIPNVVAFPGTVVPLHVFEPRYRQLVHDCVRDERLVAVSHTLKPIHQPKRQQTTEEALRSNQTTYKPHNVFSAGRCEILDTTDDGRIFAAIRMSRRLELDEEVQSLPYRIVSCTPVEDEDGAADDETNRELQHAIHARLVELVGEQNPDLARDLESAEWTTADPGEFSFRVFQVLRFEPDVMQAILEMQSARERLEITWELLKGSGSE
jgi:Lon protease-like protein